MRHCILISLVFLEQLYYLNATYFTAKFFCTPIINNVISDFVLLLRMDTYDGMSLFLFQDLTKQDVMILNHQESYVKIHNMDVVLME